jgi:hypothetical protein
MFELLGSKQRCCDGVTRRSFLRVGFLGIAGLSLADQLRRKAEARESGRSTKDTAVILIYMNGGPSHIDTYDPKPDAPMEFRGEFRPIATNVPGIQISEHLPRQARLMDKMAIVRSLTHSNAAHGMASHWMMTGYASPLETSDNLNPSCGSVTAKLRGANAPRLPAYVCLPNSPPNANAAYLGVACNPFSPGGDPNAPDFQVRDLRLTSRVDMKRFKDRRGLREGLDKLRRQRDIEGVAEGYDRFYHDAFDIVMSEDCRRAFNLDKEEPRLRDRYGRDTFGQSSLLARRLIESGVTFVAVDTTVGWDTHDNNFQILKSTNLPLFDRTVSALISDLHDRGLGKRVLVVCYGEFGRSPRVSNGAGRDHWPGAMFALLAGGGLKMGQAIGSTDGRGEYPRTRPVGPQDLLVTIYHVLGIDYRQVFHDNSGRPIPILNEGKPIEELV